LDPPISMALLRFISTCEALVILLIAFNHRAACADSAVQIDAAARSMAAVPTMPPRPNTLPSCENPLNGKGGYEPVCPSGYFRCCATCKGAPCFSEKGLYLSWRGIRECIKCSPGDYCKGCDTFQRCRPSDVVGRTGPRISPTGATRPQDCEICPTGYEADLHRAVCVKKWTHVCNAKYVKRCVRNCWAEEPKRMKNLNPCEKMKCQIYCAKQWDGACAAAFKTECLYRKTGPGIYDLYSADEEWLTDCSVDCDGAFSSHRLSTLALLCWAAVAIAGALHRD